MKKFIKILNSISMKGDKYFNIFYIYYILLIKSDFSFELRFESEIDFA